MVQKISPQEGPQEAFLSSPADIAIYGGSAGSGKTWALLLEPLRHIQNSKFNCVIFRRTSPQIRNPGGLWDQSTELFSSLGAKPKNDVLEQIFSSGAKVKFSHMEHEKDKHNWQGAQIPLIGFDELTHFTKGQFFYMLSRNRSLSGISPYIRATCNPDPDSFVAKLIDWWIDDKTGYPIPEQSGVLRWFIRRGDTIIWFDTKKEALDYLQKEGDYETRPLSLTFIAASIYDNQELLRVNPEYLSTLRALPYVEREQLLHGNWKIRPSAGNYFQRHWFEVVDDVYKTGLQRVRYWDRGATEEGENTDPDWTVGLKLAYHNQTGTYFIEDVQRARVTSGKVEKMIKNTASQDGKECHIYLEQEPGASGKFEVNYYIKQLAGYVVKGNPASKDKETRAKPASAQAEAGNIKLVQGSWNEDFLSELENFPDGAHDDQVDALSGAFNCLMSLKQARVW